MLHSFYAWAGNCPTTRIFNASVTLPADQSRTLSAAFGMNYFVKTNGNDSADGRSLATAKLTLQAAIDTASAGDTVWIDDGTYTFTSGTYGAIISKSLAVRSRNGAESVILSGNDARRLLNLNAPGAVVAGLTLKNGYSMSDWNLPSAVLLTRGHLLDCVLDGNRGTSANNDAIRFVSGWVSRCTIRNGRTTGISGGRNAAIGLLGEGLVEDCVITNNTHRKNGYIGAAVYFENALGVVRNSLIAGNTSLDTAGNTAKGAGVCFAAAGRTENCSIANNRVNGFGGGVYIASGLLPILVDNIVSGNSATAGGNDIYGQKSLFGYSCSADLANGEGGNTSADPRFTDAAAGDFRVESISPARNTGYNLLWNDLATATDLGGTSRVAEVRVDMGAYEFTPTGEEPLACTFLAEPTTGLISLTPTFTASVGGNTSGLIYTWRFGDGAITNGPDLGTVAHTYAPGYYTVTLVASNALNQHAEIADVDLIKVIPQTAYVATNGLHMAPFVSLTQAATNVESAVAVGSPDVEVAAGRFEIPAGINLALTRAVHVRGAGPGRTILDAKAKKSARIWMTHANAVLEGVTCRGGNADWNIGAILDLDNGTVTNCVFTECTTINSGAIRMTLGCVTDCVVRNTTSLATINQYTWGVGLHVLGAGRVERTIVTNNVCANYRSNGAGIRVDTTGGAVIRNCLIASNHNVPPAINEVAGGAGIYLGVAATVENCTITANRTGGSGGGLYVGNASATLRNNIIFANIATNSHYASPKQDIHDATGTALFTACCSSDLSGSGNGNLAVDPRFKDAGARDYSLNSRSPCINTGIEAEWMTAEAIDLAGNLRIRERRPDIGCYEGLSPGGTLLLLR